MDEFGVLVESIGFKAHGKSAPMAKPKPKPKAQAAASTASFDDSLSLPVDELDGIFRSSSNVDKKTRQSQNLLGGDDIFGGGQVSGSSQYGGIDFESVLNSSSNKMDAVDLNSVGGNDYGGLMRSRPRQSDSVDDLLGVFGLDSGGEGEDKGSEFDELIPGFGGASPTITGVKSKTVLPPGSNGRPSNSSSPLGDDPFSVFQSSASRSDASRPFVGPSEHDKSKDSIKSSFDEFDDFVMGKAYNDSRTDEKRNKDSNAFENVDDFDAIFGGGTPQKHGAPTSINQDFQFDIFSGENRRPESKQTSSGSSTSKTQTSSGTTMGDNFTALFGDISTSSGEFQEIEGEPEDRRRARLNRHMRTNARVAEALAEKNQRDLQSQQEQDEKHRLAETLDHDIRRWAAGKEGNLRALLSSLQQVLWPECGWRPVSLTDMITSDSVKKVYKKATLYVHPDKVQQKGATLTQKYIAEKVFDLLKEAWNKFSAEELR